MEYGFVKKVNLLFEDTLTKVSKELKKEGFGILTNIDVTEKFREKLDIEFPKYRILGACNPELAHKAIKAEWNIGLLLPCNVIVYEKNSNIFVGIIKPRAAMSMIENDNLKEVASNVEKKLRRVFNNI